MEKKKLTNEYLLKKIKKLSKKLDSLKQMRASIPRPYYPRFYRSVPIKTDIPAPKFNKPKKITFDYDDEDRKFIGDQVSHIKTLKHDVDKSDQSAFNENLQKFNKELGEMSKNIKATSNPAKYRAFVNAIANESGLQLKDDELFY